MFAPTTQQLRPPPQKKKRTLQEGRAAQGVSSWRTWLKVVLAIVLMAAIVAVVVLSVTPHNYTGGTTITEDPYIAHHAAVVAHFRTGAAKVQPDTSIVPKDTGITHASKVNPVTPLDDANKLDNGVDRAVYCGVSEKR